MPSKDKQKGTSTEKKKFTCAKCGKFSSREPCRHCCKNVEKVARNPCPTCGYGRQPSRIYCQRCARAKKRKEKSSSGQGKKTDLRTPLFRFVSETDKEALPNKEENDTGTHRDFCQDDIEYDSLQFIFDLVSTHIQACQARMDEIADGAVRRSRLRNDGSIPLHFTGQECLDFPQKEIILVYKNPACSVFAVYAKEKEGMPLFWNHVYKFVISSFNIF
mgnify:FL=1